MCSANNGGSSIPAMMLPTLTAPNPILARYPNKSANKIPNILTDSRIINVLSVLKIFIMSNISSSMVPAIKSLVIMKANPKDKIASPPRYAMSLVKKCAFNKKSSSITRISQKSRLKLMRIIGITISRYLKDLCEVTRIIVIARLIIKLAIPSVELKSALKLAVVASQEPAPKRLLNIKTTPRPRKVKPKIYCGIRSVSLLKNVLRCFFNVIV